MKILFVVPYVPSLIRVRPYNLMLALRDQGHEIGLVTLWTNEEERSEIDTLEEHGFRVFAVQMPVWRSFYNCLKSLPSQVPLQAVYSWNPELAAVMRALFQDSPEIPTYDLVHVEHLRGVNYGLHLSKVFLNEMNGTARHIPIVWDSVDCISHLFAQSAELSKKRLNRWLTRFELQKTRRYEGWLVNQFDQVLVTSSVDRDALVSLAPKCDRDVRISVLPNGVDLDYFQPDEGIENKPMSLVITGKMSYHANISMALYFAKDILPLIWEHNPQAHLTVVGKNPPREILDLAEHPAVEVTGTVTDIRPYLQRATVAVAPIIYGAGIQNKILEAMACGTPVVTSSQATAALEAQPGQDFLVGDDPADFAKAVLSLLNQPDVHVAVSLAGRRYVEQHHHWRSIVLRLESIYEDSIARISTCNNP